MKKIKKISIITPCFNEEENIFFCYESVKKIFIDLNNYDYEHIFIDNASNDNSVPILKKIAGKDKKVKIIINSRNFGLSRSPYYGMLQMTGDAAIPIVADLQTPPSLIPKMISKWEKGNKIVIAIRKSMKEGFLLRVIRNLFYELINKISKIEQSKHFIGYGLFDKKIIEVMKQFNDPTPYFRGIIYEIGFSKAYIEYDQPKRKYGNSKNNFFDLLELAFLGFTSYSTAPLRLMTLFGFVSSIISFILGLIYLIYKIIYWENFEIGIAPIIIGIFTFCSIQMMFLGIIGEYIKLIVENVKKRPLVIEEERINFE